MKEIQVPDDENAGLATDIFAKHSMVDKRIERLENKVKTDYSTGWSRRSGTRREESGDHHVWTGTF